MMFLSKNRLFYKKCYLLEALIRLLFEMKKRSNVKSFQILSNGKESRLVLFPLLKLSL